MQKKRKIDSRKKDGKHKCAQCEHMLHINSFPKKPDRPDGRSATCHQCINKNKCNKRYANSADRRDMIRKSTKKRKAKMRVWFKEYRATLQCERCDEDHPACMDFHHTDPSSKDGSINRMIRDGASAERIMAEIAKCEVLCANCHRKEHWDQLKNA